MKSHLESNISLLDKQIVGSLKLQQPAVASGRDQVALARQNFEKLAKLITDVTTYLTQLADSQDALSATDVLVLETTKRNVSQIVKALSDCRSLSTQLPVRSLLLTPCSENSGAASTTGAHRALWAGGAAVHPIQCCCAQPFIIHGMDASLARIV